MVVLMPAGVAELSKSRCKVFLAECIAVECIAPKVHQASLHSALSSIASNFNRYLLLRGIETPQVLENDQREEMEFPEPSGAAAS